jgi:hypothetical protein
VVDVSFPCAGRILLYRDRRPLPSTLQVMLLGLGSSQPRDSSLKTVGLEESGPGGVSTGGRGKETEAERRER